MRKPRWIALFFVIAALPSRAAFADEARARRLYADGEAAFGGGRYAEAARPFEAAFSESQHPGLLWNVAQSYRKQYALDHDIVNLRRALSVYQNYLELLPQGADPAEAKAMLAEVTLQIERLEAAGKPSVVAARPDLVPAPAPRLPPTRSRRGLALGLGLSGGALVLGAAALGLGVTFGHKTVEQGLYQGNIDPGYQRIAP